jgi:hypothetical protein
MNKLLTYSCLLLLLFSCKKDKPVVVVVDTEAPENKTVYEGTISSIFFQGEQYEISYFTFLIKEKNGKNYAVSAYNDGAPQCSVFFSGNPCLPDARFTNEGTYTTTDGINTNAKIFFTSVDTAFKLTINAGITADTKFGTATHSLQGPILADTNTLTPSNFVKDYIDKWNQNPKKRIKIDKTPTEKLF